MTTEEYKEALLNTIDVDDRPSGMFECDKCRFIHGSKLLWLYTGFPVVRLGWRCSICHGKVKQFCGEGVLWLVPAVPGKGRYNLIYTAHQKEAETALVASIKQGEHWYYINMGPDQWVQNTAKSATLMGAVQRVIKLRFAIQPVLK